MTMKDQAKKLVTGAGVAIATTGLSTCTNGGAVDPVPPALQCNTLNAGQQLLASVTQSADTLNVSVVHLRLLEANSWRVDSVTVTSGATLVSSTVPRPNTFEPLLLVLRLANSTTTRVTFEVEATVLGIGRNTCAVRRTFTITISPTGVEISSAGTDELPLAARQRANIVVTQQQGRTVELAARTPYLGPREMSWSVNAGHLDASTGSVVQWTLPPKAGIYQAELVVDFGADGVAFDVLMLEVV
jgi:hypothetical protein